MNAAEIFRKLAKKQIEFCLLVSEYEITRSLPPKKGMQFMSYLVVGSQRVNNTYNLTRVKRNILMNVYKQNTTKYLSLEYFAIRVELNLGFVALCPSLASELHHKCGPLCCPEVK